MRRIASLVVLLLLAVVAPATGATSTAIQKERALHRLGLLHTVTASSLKGYSPKRFPHWLDPDRNGCDAREDTLIGAGTHVTRGRHCTIRSGSWVDEYSGRTYRSPLSVTADHLVPLANAWRTGARRWSRARRAQYANDPVVLVVTSMSLDRQKGSRSPDQWKPPRRGDWFAYAERWIRIKTKYHLGVTRPERAALRRMLNMVPGSGDPKIAAAGDIACDPASGSFNGGAGTDSSCRQRAVSTLMLGQGYSAVLPLGDTQYYCGGLSDYQRSYDLSWGRLLSASHPVVGNHEYLPSGGDRLRQHRSGERVLQLLRLSRRQYRAGVLQLQRRHLAPDRAQLQLRQRRRLQAPRTRRGDGWRRPRGQPERLHPGLLAHPALQLRRPRRRHTTRPSGTPSTPPAPTSSWPATTTSTSGSPRRPQRRDGHHPRPARVRGRHRRRQPHLASPRSSPTARSATATPSASSSSPCTRRATTGSSSPTPGKTFTDSRHHQLPLARRAQPRHPAPRHRQTKNGPAGNRS